MHDHTQFYVVLRMNPRASETLKKHNQLGHAPSLHLTGNLDSLSHPDVCSAWTIYLAGPRGMRSSAGWWVWGDLGEKCWILSHVTPQPPALGSS